jgi:hypothetical protein
MEHWTFDDVSMLIVSSITEGECGAYADSALANKCGSLRRQILNALVGSGRHADIISLANYGHPWVKMISAIYMLSENESVAMSILNELASSCHKTVAFTVKCSIQEWVNGAMQPRNIPIGSNPRFNQLDKYKIMAISQGETWRYGDQSLSIRCSEELERIFQALIGAGQEKKIGALIKHGHPWVQMWAAVHSLGPNEEIAVAALVRLSQSKDHPSNLPAGKALSQWRSGT